MWPLAPTATFFVTDQARDRVQVFFAASYGQFSQADLANTLVLTTRPRGVLICRAFRIERPGKIRLSLGPCCELRAGISEVGLAELSVLAAKDLDSVPALIGDENVAGCAMWPHLMGLLKAPSLLPKLPNL